MAKDEKEHFEGDKSSFLMAWKRRYGGLVACTLQQQAAAGKLIGSTAVLSGLRTLVKLRKVTTRAASRGSHLNTMMARKHVTNCKHFNPFR